MRTYHLLFGLVVFTLILGVIVMLYFQSERGMTEVGFLEGSITIGPLCPTVAQQTACDPTEETYRSWPIVVWTDDTKKVKQARVAPDASGSYQMELPEGTYVIDLGKEHVFGSNLPAEITILPSATTTFDINIDTGIR